MRKRIRFLSVKEGVGKTLFTVLAAYYLRSLEIGFLIEELDPLNPVFTLAGHDLPVIKFFDINDVLYRKLEPRAELEKEYSTRDWTYLIADMPTGIKPGDAVVLFQDSILDTNLNVFLTDVNSLDDTVRYAEEWKDGEKFLVVNMVPENEVDEVTEVVNRLVYGKFVSAFVTPYDDKVSFLNPAKLNWFTNLMKWILA
jgi:MinD-like ATPase involved in chromosome partitioning or flagellar assembly